ncbi:MAG: HD domain-containing protein [Pirellulaceae bacterium]|nr:HD domain-containing protein [Pirellulaceae bacterium]
MSAKIFRDPLYNYIALERQSEKWLIELLDTPEVQRLGRIHQLGVSYLTYRGADHNRLAHSLGVLHLMQQATAHLCSEYEDAQVEQAQVPLLAAALIHDVGHGPFSHLFEPCLEIDHEEWSKKVILCEDQDMKVHKVLKNVDRYLPNKVAELIDKDNYDHPSWMKYLLSSQLDMDRLDYLRRDSLFTGAGYGHYDFYRIVNTLEFHVDADGTKNIVWSERSKFAIEEYVFARHYMYQNVYLHKTTRGFEKLLLAMWKRAKLLRDNGDEVSLVPAIQEFWAANDPTVQQYLRIEEFTVLQQIQNWTTHPDKSLSDLARRFLNRNRFSMIEPPPPKDGLAPSNAEWEAALLALVKAHSEFDPPEMYCLKDEVKGKYNQPYFPEKEEDDQSVKNAIRLLVDGKPVEISQVLERLKPLTQEPVERVRYYIPRELLAEARKLRAEWK